MSTGWKKQRHQRRRDARSARAGIIIADGAAGRAGQRRQRRRVARSAFAGIRAKRAPNGPVTERAPTITVVDLSTPSEKWNPYCPRHAYLAGRPPSDRTCVYDELDEDFWHMRGDESDYCDDCY